MWTWLFLCCATDGKDKTRNDTVVSDTDPPGDSTDDSGDGDTQDSATWNPPTDPCVDVAVDTGSDDDGDGFSSDWGDCDDRNAAIHPEAEEITGNGIDENCDDLDVPGETIKGHELCPLWDKALAGNSLATGDLNDDGYQDLLIGSPTTGDVEDDDAWGTVVALMGPLDRDMALSEGIEFTGEYVNGHNLTGWTVVVPGDMNGDGLDDFAYGIPFGNSGEKRDYLVSAGRVFTVDGPTEIGNNYELTDHVIYGGGDDGCLGFGLAAAGDANGDGLADLLVGAPRIGNDREELAPGRALIFLGPLAATTEEADANLTLIGESDTDYAGLRLNSGDFNSDGHPDILVGGIWSDPTGTSSGQAWLVYGPVSGTHNLLDAGARLLGEAEGDYAGAEVASAGDLDGDGDDEVLVDAQFSAADGTRSGRAYLLYGPVTGTLGLEASDATFSAAGAYDWVGYRMGTAGDLNGDGLSELVIAAPQQYEYSTGRRARLSLYEGPLFGAIAPEDASRIWVSPSYNDSFGTSFLAGPDLTGDGNPDLTVGAPYDRRDGTPAGRVYISPM